MIASASPLEESTMARVNFSWVDLATKDEPYGTGEFMLLQRSLGLLQSCGVEDVIKLPYDMILDHANFPMLREWMSRGAVFTSCYWNGDPSAVGTWAWSAPVWMAREIFAGSGLRGELMERFVRQRLDNLGFPEYMYPDPDAMFMGTWKSHGDLVVYGGKVLRKQMDKRPWNMKRLWTMLMGRKP